MNLGQTANKALEWCVEQAVSESLVHNCVDDRVENRRRLCDDGACCAKKNRGFVNMCEETGPE